MKVEMNVNGQKVSIEAPSMKRLLDVLREDVSLTGTKEGCGEGECGACSVMMNGRLVNSCLIPIAQAQGSTIKTIEGLQLSETQLSKLQTCFIENGGAQCGICTPGMILAAQALIDSHPNPSEEDVRVGLAGNLCRCTGYTKIFESVLAAVER